MDLAVFCYDAENEAEVRTTTINGDAWFCAKDVCSILGLTNTAMSIQRLDDDEKIQLEIASKGGVTEAKTILPAYKLSFISESGLYHLIFSSIKEEAQKFRRWICKEVIPKIRKTGKYETQALATQQIEPVTNDFIKSLIESPHIKAHCHTLYHLALDIAIQRLQGQTSDSFVRIKDISAHMVDLGINPSIIKQYRTHVGRYVKKQYTDMTGEEPPTSDKEIRYKGKIVQVSDHHNGANRPVCWYAPEYYDDVRKWIMEYFSIKHPNVNIKNSPLQLI